MSARCSHALVVDEIRELEIPQLEPWHVGPPVQFRACLLCGVSYNRDRLLDRLRNAIQERHRLPKGLPWAEVGLEGP